MCAGGETGGRITVDSTITDDLKRLDTKKEERKMGEIHLD
jgi:hypothetical protein